MQCSADQFPFDFWDELSVWGLATLVFSFLIFFFFDFFFMGLFKTYSNHPGFSKWDCWMRERQLAGQDTHKVYEGWKVKERSPSSHQKKRKPGNKNNTFLRRPTPFEETPPAVPLRSAPSVARAGVEVTVQECDLDSIKGISSVSERGGSRRPSSRDTVAEGRQMKG